MGVGLAAGLALAGRRFGPVLPWASIGRGVLIGAALFLLARWWHATGLVVVVKGGVLVLAAAAALAASGEIPLARFLRKRSPLAA
jgi:hypothetical protein